MNINASTQLYHNIRPANWNKPAQHEGKKSEAAEKQHVRQSNQQGIHSNIYKSPQNYKAGERLNAQGIKALQRHADSVHDALRTLVRKLLKQQGAEMKERGVISEEPIDDDNVITLPVTGSSDANNEWGAEQTAARIFNFAISLAGHDKSKIAELKDAVMQGFAEAKRILGGLPEVSLETYDEVMRLFDEWEQSE